jgi:hypothetical protein
VLASFGTSRNRYNRLWNRFAQGAMAQCG